MYVAGVDDSGVEINLICKATSVTGRLDDFMKIHANRGVFISFNGNI